MAERNPYLSRGELQYFDSLGPRLWLYTQVWFDLGRVMETDLADWGPGELALELERMRRRLEEAPERANYSSMDDVGLVVRSYADSLEEGMRGVDLAVSNLSRAQDLLAEAAAQEAGLTSVQRIDLLQWGREVERRLVEFDAVMSAYGCSVCGELFRQAAAP